MKKALLLALCAIITSPCTFAMEKETPTKQTDQPDLFAQLPRDLHKEFVVNMLKTYPNAIENLKTLQKLMLTSKQKAQLKNLFANQKNVIEFCFALKNTTENIFRSLYLLYVYKFISEKQYRELYEQFQKEYPKEFEAHQKDEETFTFDFIRMSNSSDINKLQEWINKGINVNTPDIGGGVLIVYAFTTGSIEFLKLLLAAPGIDVNRKDIRGSTALTIATQLPHYEKVKLLIEAPNIDVNLLNDFWRMTALMWAAFYGNTELVELLLAVPGIDVNFKTIRGTALMLASENGHVAVVKLLLEFPGIDVFRKNNDGKTALDLAKTEEIKNLIKEKQNEYYTELFGKYLPLWSDR